MASSTARSTSGPERLTPDDDVFVRMEQALGMPAVNQCVWRLQPAESTGRVPFDANALHRLAEGLSSGRLARLAIRSRLPVRDRWVYSTRAGARHFDAAPIAPGTILDWARTQCEYPLDFEQGPVWRLSAVPTDDDEIIVSLIVSHVIADGVAALTAVVETLLGLPYSRGNGAPTLVDGLRESAFALTDAARSVVALLRRDNTPAVPRPAPPHPVAPALAAGAPARAATTVVSVAADDFDTVAAARNGTSNSLFIALVIGLLEASGRVSTGDVVPVSLPMSTRNADDRRANATTGVTAAVEISNDRYTDLQPIRTASKAAFASIGSGPGPLELMSRAAQPLGDSIVRRLVADSTLPLCLASNLGELPPVIPSLGTSAVGCAAMRTLPAPISAAQLRQVDGGIHGWCSRSAGKVTMSFAALDPDRVADDAALAVLVADELSRWSLAGTLWAEPTSGNSTAATGSKSPQ